jgi:protein-S-isoprenylcysteine O-methyltransferase Ste14
MSCTSRVLMVIIGTIAYFNLAILGWASLTAFFSHSALVPPLLARIKAEEALLSSQFGDVYEEFRARTARLIPGLY